MPMPGKGDLDVSKIHYLYIRDISFNYSRPNAHSPQEEQPIQFRVSIEKNISEENRIVILQFNVQLKTSGQNKEEVTGSHVSEHEFKVENLEDFIKKGDDFFEVDDQLDNMLTGLAYSTVRGILLQKFRGTLFSDFLLPVAKPVDLIGRN
jgi:hypothetical protein